MHQAPANRTRREFITQTAAIAGMAALLPFRAAGETGRTPANDRITLGGIGLGRRGRDVLRNFLTHSDVQFVAIADVQERNREIIRRIANRHYDNDDCATYRDMHELLARPDIDAVLIATSDRWHGTASIYAARAGKDIFCEKPCTMSIAESQELDSEILKTKRIFQGGMQRRNVDNFQVAVDLARSGKLGKLQTLHAGIWLPRPLKPDLPGQPEPDPTVVDWDRWLGPTPARPYNETYLTDWRYYNGFSAGWGLHDWASHTANLCQWAVAADNTAPVEYWTEGDRICARYANGVKLVMRRADREAKEGDWLGLGSCPVRFEGDSGWVEVGDQGKIAVSAPSILDGDMPSGMLGIDPTKHVREFLDCVKSRGSTSCNSTVTRHSEIACHAAAISWKLDRKLKFDPAKERFINDAEADALCSSPRREPFTV